MAQPGMGPPPGGGGGGEAGPACGTSVVSSTKDFEMSHDADFRYITTNGCPGYDWTAQTTPNDAEEDVQTYKFPLNPTICEETYNVGINGDPVMGSIGVATNGVVYFGPSDADNRDAFIYEGATFDSCNGHAAPGGAYHYHYDPTCLYDETSGDHSPLVGFMFDGVPIYGPQGDGGAVPGDLDACGGHTDETHAFYHYHMSTDYPYTIDCFKGRVETTNNPMVTGQTCTAASTQYDYSSLDDVSFSYAGTTDDSGVPIGDDDGGAAAMAPTAALLVVAAAGIVVSLRSL